MKEGALEKEIDTSKVASTHKFDAAHQGIDPKGHDLPPDYAKAALKFLITVNMIKKYIKC